MRLARVLLLLCAAPALADLRAEDVTPLGARLPLVVIHGWNASPETFDSFVQQLGGHPAAARVKVYRFGYDWSRGIATSADLLRRDLAAQPELAGRAVILVGHSMGGLVARSYAEARLPGWDGPERVGLLITLATPHHGSAIANLEWLGGDSRYSLLAKLMPTGLFEFLNRIPIFGAVRTEGGHNLGWDNYDGAMPADLWAGADRYLERLNRDLDLHPLGDELLLRYRLFTGYTESIPPLSIASLTGRVREGDHYGAGCALLAHGFRDARGQTISHWSLNDGVVSVDSAAFLQPGPPLTQRAGDELRTDWSRLRARERRPGLVATPVRGVDHSGITRDPRLVAAVLDQVAGYEPNLLVLTVDGQLVGLRPGRPAAPLAGPGAEPVALAATTSRRLILCADDAIGALAPSGWRVIARGPGLRDALLSPDGRLAVLPDGAVIGLAASGYRRLAAAASAGTACWSPDSTRLAYLDDQGELHLAGAADLLSRPASRDAAPVAAGLRPLAWTADSRWLMATDSLGLTAALPRPDAGELVLTVAGAEPVRGVVVGASGEVAEEWRFAPEGGAANRLVLLGTAGTTATVLAEGADAPLWSPDSSWLAWREGLNGDTLAIRRGGETRRVELGGPASRAIAVSSAQILVAAGGAATRLLSLDAATGTVTELARAAAPVAPASAPVLSPDGRHVAVPLDGSVLVAAIDGGWWQELPGAGPVWLPAPADERWTAAAAPRP